MLYYLSLGSNIGDREQTLRRALLLMEQQIGRISRCSSFYYSAPWGFESEHEFCNLCCALETALTPHEVLHRTQAIELQLGRTRKSADGHYADRTVDIDIIQAFDGDTEITVTTPELTIPHPLWQEREFVCVPLNEIKEAKNSNKV
ncbi:MAG: 2-amino-4-hydroxy-6-hydroxymethyldihydropteridine diphosphokinase [Paludibacteraceae bacterium]|nr:2-amino-4-hydroxy-6-hydroxymethyldihydropteridine diphosphokinase [Paludibacteraceae bacterium]